MKQLLAILAVLTLCTACTQPPVPLTPSPTPSPTPEPKTLTVCLPSEPESLYLYGSDSVAAQHVWQAIYDGPIDSRSYAYQPIILTGLPSLTNGGAAVETVTVQAGDRVLAASGEVVELAPGVAVEDARGERTAFERAPIPMHRMVVTFTLHPGVYWSDGILLTADDSVFSFEVASDPASPTDKYVIERTADYRAVDTHTVVWSGVPGFVDQAYFLNFWHPLPRHAWSHLSAADMLTADETTHQPLGWGPFVISEWVPGDHLTAVRNPIYFRVPEGLPRVDEVTFRFMFDPTALAEGFVRGGCDVVTHDGAGGARAVLSSGHAQSSPAPPAAALLAHDARWELLAFGITPAKGYDRPDFFEDVRVRQAIALCTDRQGVVNALLGPTGQVLHSYVPPEHPLYAGERLTTWRHDPAAGLALLEAAGWRDDDGDGVREAHRVAGIADGTPFRVTYRTTEEALRVHAARLIQRNLAACGIQVSVETMPAESLLAPGPEGVLFGRQFDLAQFSWRATSDPLCDLFLSSQIPDTGRWERPNVAGFLDHEYDTACLEALQALPGSQPYVAHHIEAQRIFSERLPVLPLFQRLKVTLAKPSVSALVPDPTEPSELWNLEQVDVQP